ncbi:MULTISPECIES: ABC transporter substrate-binding protein [Actinomadura]|uniref:NitT/TauT family transport system substrate-binding protein n=1 Tax=Actinomadura madurae TaxID=1993 RepID=A0A1I4ZZ25_9ACTN|nr:ABC transporter substrate-binding protein [Actinomadura madurae]MCP9948904.1 ABC transporter substrate-binding protein [Actinomadura madurae]MCP9965678.1 ABC transporter substrate-binding protein [Actinomadura madurae]MCP9978148.1 ABC transporter substrate-binding protein [Actinomadura madurae]MCQ0010332.1 ABC transporter substrate-binding protein [Actinomadura madurae]MCQ0014354.1 ABC transporter substrate-binding protein [Actinomadura madurae]
MRQSLRLSALVSAFALVASVIAGCGDSDSSGGGKGLETDTIKVASLPLVDGAALYVAQKAKLFEAEGLDVKIVPVQQSIQALPALTKGDVNVIAGANYVSFLQANEKGTLKLSILAEAATLTSNMMNVLVMPDSKIKTAKDLEGKKVAVNILNNIQSLTLDAILKANNVDPKKVKYVQVPFPQMATALQKGQVDSIHTVEPFLSDTEKKLGARVAVDGGSEPVTDLPISGFVTTQEWSKKNPKTAAAFQRAIIKAQKMATQDRKKVEEVLPSYAKIDPQVASVITLPGFPTSLSKTRMQRVSELMSTSGLLKEKPDLNAILFQPTS